MPSHTVCLRVDTVKNGFTKSYRGGHNRMLLPFNITKNQSLCIS